MSEFTFEQRQRNLEQLQIAYSAVKAAIIHLGRVEELDTKPSEKSPDKVVLDLYGPLGALGRLVDNRGGSL